MTIQLPDYLRDSTVSVKMPCATCGCPVYMDVPLSTILHIVRHERPTQCKNCHASLYTVVEQPQFKPTLSTICKSCVGLLELRLEEKTGRRSPRHGR